MSAEAMKMHPDPDANASDMGLKMAKEIELRPMNRLHADQAAR